MASESSTLLEQAQAASKDRAYERALELFNQASASAQNWRRPSGATRSGTCKASLQLPR